MGEANSMRIENDATTLTFDGRVAVVTGAGRGLGREYALRLAERGASVLVNDSGVSLDGVDADRTPAEEVAAEVTVAGGIAVADNTVVGDQAGGQQLIDAAMDHFGRVDIVINNAGVLRDGAFHKLTAEQIDPVLQVHLSGSLYVARAAWPIMREQSYGRIVNTTSTSGLFGNFGQANYASAKSGVVGLTRTLSIEGERYGIRVNAVAPGAKTRMTPDGAIPETVDLSPGLVSPVVVWLAHEQCEVTGEIFRASGGHVARIFVGVTRGYRNAALTAEDVVANLNRIRDFAEFEVPTSAMDVGAKWS
jgi:NAD(P)-dependent dehydrogenase (short-subunit alcohol dehydrogenase family)